MSENPKNTADEGPKEAKDITRTLEATAGRRAKYTREYFDQTKKDGKSLDDFVAALAKPPFNIEIRADDDKSLTLGIFALQQKLGFKVTLSAQGCDGMCGPYTYMKYGKFVLAQADHAKEVALRQDVQSAAPVEQKEKPSELLAKNTLTKKYQPAEIVAVGDSLMEDTSNILASWRGEKRGKFMDDGSVKIGRQLTHINPDGKDNETYAMKALRDPACKLLLLNGGFNDLDTYVNAGEAQPDNSPGVIDRVIASYQRIIAFAHQQGKQVAVYTVHTRRFGKGVPEKEQRIKAALPRLNGWLLNNSGADLVLNPNVLPNEDYYPDGVHWKPTGARKIMDAFKKASV